MKQLLTTLLLVCSFTLIGCGGSGASPGDTVTEFARAMEAGDAEKMKELCPDLEKTLGSGMIDKMATQMKEEAEESGGIKSITIDKEEINGDTAKVTATVTNGNGDSKAEDFELEKVDGKWVIVMGEDMKNGGPGGGGINISGGGEDAEFPDDFEVPEEFEVPEGFEVPAE
ncbi:MAG: DUF4878 domain-containing protein [Planctomycetota bacterium]